MTAYRSQDATKPVPCGTCGTFIDPKTATFSLDGNLSCQPCASRGQIAAAEVRGLENPSSNSGWVRIAIVVALVMLRLLLKLSHP